MLEDLFEDESGAAGADAQQRRRTAGTVGEFPVVMNAILGGRRDYLGRWHYTY